MLCCTIWYLVVHICPCWVKPIPSCTILYFVIQICTLVEKCVPIWEKLYFCGKIADTWWIFGEIEFVQIWVKLGKLVQFVVLDVLVDFVHVRLI